MDLLKTVLHGVNVGITFLIVITVLIAVHEYGHYLFARMCGMHVEAFAVMVGGVRKTKLDQHLERPLAPQSLIWAIGSAIAILTFLGGFFAIQPLFFGGLAFLTIVGPVWIISRLCALYHRPLTAGILTLFKSWGVVAIILAAGTRFQNVDPGYALSMFLTGSICAVLLVYYFPVLTSNDPEGNKGHGKVIVKGNPTHVQFRPLLAKTNKEGTEFSLLLLPLGGFAAIKGMHPQEDGSETKIDKGFFSKSPIKRLAVLFAGPLFSVLFGVLLFFATIMAQGVPDKPTTTIGFLGNGPAKAAGLQVGDKITSINNEPVATFNDILVRVRDSFDKDFKALPVTVGILRDGQAKSYTFLPTVTKEAVAVMDENLEETGLSRRQAKLEFNPDFSYKPVPIGTAATRAFSAPVVMVVNLGYMLTNPQIAKENVGGPGAMVEQTSQSINAGFIKILELAALLSISLGILNLLPIPPLDGGQMVIAFVELIRGNKRLPMSVQMAMQNIGAVVVMVLMLAVFAVDAGRRSELNKIKEDTRVESR